MLVKASLSAALKGIFNERLREVGEAADRIAKAYEDYARMGQSPSGAPVVIRGLEKLQLSMSLSLLMKSRYPSIEAAQQVAMGVTGFWLTPPVITLTGGVCSGILTGPGVSALIYTRASSIDDAADSMANALHMMTKSVFFAEVPPLVSGVIL